MRDIILPIISATRITKISVEVLKYLIHCVDFVRNTRDNQPVKLLYFNYILIFFMYFYKERKFVQYLLYINGKMSLLFVKL